MPKRRKFIAEFKRGAVEQASQPGVGCVQVARELGIRDTLPTRWKREIQSRGAVAFGDAGISRDEEMARLKREHAQTRVGPSHDVPDIRCRRADVFEYIERLHNQGMRRRVARQDPKFSALSPLSVISG